MNAIYIVFGLIAFISLSNCATDDDPRTTSSTTAPTRLVINLPTYLPTSKPKKTINTVQQQAVIPLRTTTFKTTSSPSNISPVGVRPALKQHSDVITTNAIGSSAAKRAVNSSSASSSNVIVTNALSAANPSKSSIDANSKTNIQPNADKPAAAAGAVSKSVNGTALSDAYECPIDEVFQLFPTYCTRHGECIRKSGSEFRCCKQQGGKRCVKAVARPIPEPKHEPILGFIPRKCPQEPLAELFWDLQTCDTDRDCWPRVCCPDGIKKYCRTAQPELAKSSYSVARQLSTPLESVSKYIQCTPPPPAVFDQFPKKCNSTLECFPNVCCQEAGRKHCRPPKRSLLALFTGFATRFNTGAIRDWTRSLVIR